MGRPVDGIGPVATDRLNRGRNTVSAKSYYWKKLLFSAAVFVVGVAVASQVVGQDWQRIQTLRGLLPPGRYLVLFQNNAELRPSGGFIGSFAEVNLAADGSFKIDVDTNIYKRDDAFTRQVDIAVPEPLQGVAEDDRWALKDSNWDPDFRDAAERINWFYSQEGGDSVDGVIAVNASVLVDVLKLTGPVKISNGQLLTADSVLDDLHFLIERGYWYDPNARVENEPKKVIAELIPTLRSRLTQPVAAIKLSQLLFQELEEKQIQLYHRDEEVESQIISRGWSGTIDPTTGDYLAVNNASVGGQKSSLKVIEEINLQVSKDEDKLLHHLDIYRTHTGDGQWPDHVNENYLRFLTPLGSRLKSLEIDGVSRIADVEEKPIAGKSSFGIHMPTDPGATSHLTAVYETDDWDDYSLTYQKQSGVIGEKLTVIRDGRTIFSSSISKDLVVDD